MTNTKATHLLFFFQMCVRVCECVCPPVIVLGQRHLLEVDVEPVALGGLQNPVARQVVAVVAREARRDDATVGGVLYHAAAGC